jgi:hypothetical protein
MHNPSPRIGIFLGGTPQESSPHGFRIRSQPRCKRLVIKTTSKLHTTSPFPKQTPPFVAPPPLGNPPQDQSLLSLIAGDLRLLEKHQTMRKRKMA